MDAAARDAQVDGAHRNEACKLLRKVLGFEDDLSTHNVPQASAIVGMFTEGVKENGGRDTAAAHRTVRR